MALRQEDLLVREAVVYRFPTETFLRRAARRRMLARRRRALGLAAVVMAIGLLAGSGPEGAVAAGPADHGSVPVGAF